MSLLTLLQSATAAGVVGEGAWAQSATWDATATETVTAVGSWTQTASWSATGAESMDAVASFHQDATWEASGSEAITSTAEFVQAAATWQASDSPLITATGEWTQDAATWDATADSSEAPIVPVGPPGGAFIAGPAYTMRQRVRIIAREAAFAQMPARWAAEMATSDDELVLELLEMAA